jgi:broad specificity phosphatase PhoE
MAFHCSLFLLISMPLAVPSSALSAGGWTATAIEACKTLAASQREQLQQAGAIGVARPITIVAERNSEDDPKPAGTKIIHFQRHGQGYHNLLGDVWRELKLPIDFDSNDISKNPFLRNEIVDSPLTESGRQQSMARRPEAALLNPQVLIVSPLLRAIQTSYLSFTDHKDAVPWIAHEGCREELGLLVCNKRRRLSEIREDYPDIDYSHIQDEEDLLFDADNRESVLAKSERVYSFLVDFIRTLPHDEIAVVGHSAWLFNMCNAVMDCGGDEDLMSWFLTSEIRSMRIRFIENA